MKKGYSIVITSSDSGNSKYLFLSRPLIVFVLSLFIVVLIILVVASFNYSQVYLKAVGADELRRRNVEIEKEFAKIEEIKKNLELAEVNNKKIKIMLGIEKTPELVEPGIDKESQDYADRIKMYFEKEQNIPSLLPTIGMISRNFGTGHEGIDIAAPRFSPVTAAASGTVNATGWDSLFGNYVVIEHNRNYSTFYGHLNSVDVKKDNKIIGGRVIGTIGSSGRSSSPHLHYEVRFRGKPVDPMGYLPYYNYIKL